jgi:hypothetical protein
MSTLKWSSELGTKRNWTSEEFGIFSPSASNVSKLNIGGAALPSPLANGIGPPKGTFGSTCLRTLISEKFVRFTPLFYCGNSG